MYDDESNTWIKGDAETHVCYSALKVVLEIA